MADQDVRRQDRHRRAVGSRAQGGTSDPTAPPLPRPRGYVPPSLAEPNMEQFRVGTSSARSAVPVAQDGAEDRDLRLAMCGRCLWLPLRVQAQCEEPWGPGWRCRAPRPSPLASPRVCHSIAVGRNFVTPRVGARDSVRPRLGARGNREGEVPRVLVRALSAAGGDKRGTGPGGGRAPQDQEGLDAPRGGRTAWKELGPERGASPRRRARPVRAGLFRAPTCTNVVGDTGT